MPLFQGGIFYRRPALVILGFNVVFIIMKTKHLSLPKPCSQSWTEMTVQGQGRFCSSCQKTVIDFTEFDDAAFIAYFQQATELPCGRLNRRQLELAIPLQQNRLRRPLQLYRYVAAGVLSIAGIPATTEARQTTATAVYAADHQDQAGQETEPATSDSVEVRGMVVDENEEGIPGASVYIKNTETRTMTDVDGNFSLRVSSLQKAQDTLAVKAVGFSETKKLLNTITDKTIVRLAMSQSILGEVVVSKKPTFWQRITKPFRRRH